MHVLFHHSFFSYSSSLPVPGRKLASSKSSSCIMIQLVSQLFLLSSSTCLHILSLVIMPVPLVFASSQCKSVPKNCSVGRMVPVYQKQKLPQNWNNIFTPLAHIVQSPMCVLVPSPFNSPDYKLCDPAWSGKIWRNATFHYYFNSPLPLFHLL